MAQYTRQANMSDLDDAMRVLQAGIAYLKEQGSPQWQDGQGPTVTQVTDDIHAGFGHVLVLDGVVVGYGALIPGPEDVYEQISDGGWVQTGLPYVAIHRIAIDTSIRGRGLSKTMFHDLIILARARGFRDIRVDTYPGNLIMQKVILGAGFEYRGQITFPFAHGERLGYQLVID
jgi:GNAT superfamily N-acetyltransferase